MDLWCGYRTSRARARANAVKYKSLECLRQAKLAFFQRFFNARGVSNTPRKAQSRRVSTPRGGGVTFRNVQRGYPTGFHPWLNARWYPACAGYMGKQTVLASANRVSMHNAPTPQTNARCSITPAALITHAYRQRTHPALRGVLPCIKPTVKTVGVTTPDTSRHGTPPCAGWIRGRFAY